MEILLALTKEVQESEDLDTVFCFTALLLSRCRAHTLAPIPPSFPGQVHHHVATMPVHSAMLVLTFAVVVCCQGNSQDRVHALLEAAGRLARYGPLARQGVTV